MRPPDPVVELMGTLLLLEPQVPFLILGCPYREPGTSPVPGRHNSWRAKSSDMAATCLGTRSSLRKISLPLVLLQSGSLRSSQSIPTSNSILLRSQGDLESKGREVPMNSGSCIDAGQ
jgi:hypothetical protein